MTPVYDLSLPGERERLQASLIHRTPRQGRLLFALAMSGPARQAYVDWLREKKKHAEATQLIDDIRAYKRERA